MDAILPGTDVLHTAVVLLMRHGPEELPGGRRDHARQPFLPVQGKKTVPNERQRISACADHHKQDYHCEKEGAAEKP
jgi:hypothetical protein